MSDKGKGLGKDLEATAGLKIACKICSGSMLRQTQGPDLFYFCRDCQRSVQIKL